MTFSNSPSPGVALQGGGGSGGGGGGTPGGSSGQVQYNNASAFGGMSGTAWNDTNRALTITGATLTANAPILDLTQTWNNAAVTFTGIKLNATSTASAAASLLMDLQVGGATVLRVGKDGSLTNPTYNGDFSWRNGDFVMRSSSALFWSAPGVAVGGTSSIEFKNTQAISGTSDLFLSRRGTANLNLGAADVAAPVPQLLSVQSVVAGTANTAGANFTITGSQSTGTGAGGSIIFQVAPAAGAGSAQNALSTALTINSNQSATFARTSGSDAVVDLQFGGSANTGWYSTGGSSTLIASFAGTRMMDIRAAGVSFSNGTILLGPVAGNQAVLVADAANTLALKNGANAQEFRVYETTTGTIYKAILGNRGLMKISGAAFADGAGAQAGTLTNAPAVGNPTKWISIDDNGTTRYIPAW